MKTVLCDTLIIGTGLAGLMTAHTLSSDQYVICLTKGLWKDCNSYLAQGGIACVTSPEDHWLSLAEDTLLAGRHHNIEHHVQTLTKDSPEIIQKLIELGVSFDRGTNGNFLRTREGGHRLSRILHAGGDATGMKVMESLKKRIPSHVDIHEHTQAVELFIESGQCKGIWARNAEDELVLYISHYTVLASGGLGQLFSHTTNAKTITGDGIALAFHAGARCTDLEFVQFHPTLLDVPNNRGDLISEAVRGEGAVLRNQNDHLIMEQVHPLKDLAPRDIVARTIFTRILKGEKIHLDIRPINNFDARFPTIAGICSNAGIDLSKGEIPVSPGAHFVMGGIETDECGETSLSRLFAIGETACTGIHGANRLASNSLLEAAGYAIRVGKVLNERLKIEPPIDWSKPPVNLEQQVCFKLPSKYDIQEKVSDCLGIIRDRERLEQLQNWLTPFIDAYRDQPARVLTKNQSERWNMVSVAYIMTLSMIERTESRGAHYRLDYPNEHPNWLQKRLPRERVTVEHY